MTRQGFRAVSFLMRGGEVSTRRLPTQSPWTGTERSAAAIIPGWAGSALPNITARTRWLGMRAVMNLHP